jgi:glycerol-3-phosphate acyltransferase PlsY
MIAGKFKGVDIRKMGSGNAGGTNAFRTMGTQFALVVLFIDVIKGFIAVQFISILSLERFLPNSNINSEILSIICGCGAVLGHVYPLFYNFKGGKGAGTMMGVLLALFPKGLAICLFFWLMSLIITGYVGFSTIIAGIILPISTALYYKGGLTTTFGIFTIVISIFIIFTHRRNIIRMMDGKESRFEKAMIFRKKT